MADTTYPFDPIATAKTFLPELQMRAAELDKARRMPADLAMKLAEAGLFRLVIPASLGGLETPPQILMATIEALAEGNASAGWCAMIAATTALNAAYLDPVTAQEIYGSSAVITGGVFAPLGKAVIEDGGYRVTGRWPWASGSANCHWLCAGAVIIENGSHRRLPDGSTDTRMMIFPRQEVDLLDTWHVAGLKGTGSSDIAVKNLFVPNARSVSLISDTPVEQGPLYTFPAFGLLALGVASVASGNARGALQSFSDLARTKKSQGSRRTLAEREGVQNSYANANAKLRAARAYLTSEVVEAWEQAQNQGELSAKQRADLRLACTHMVRTAAKVCHTAYDLGGGAALFLDNDLQRRFRDAHAMTQHIVTAPATYDWLGRILLDLPTDTKMI